MTILVIVESPAKCKKIESFLGKGYICKASFGHIRDLEAGLGAIDVTNNFKPKYRSIDGKDTVIADLHKYASKATEVLLASDLDREGEAIAFHVATELNLDIATTKRITFNEITKKAITHAIKNPRTIDMNLFDSQQARRILDRLIGFELSPLLWKHIQANLSAGRCQSPALRLLCEREDEINNFTSSTYYQGSGEFLLDEYVINADLNTHLADEASAKTVIDNYSSDDTVFTATNTNKSNTIRKPSAPFTTSTLQQEASTTCSISPKQCMLIAQKLYEAGKITYMRTDSTLLADTALQSIQEYVCNTWGQEYHKQTQYTTKSKSSQEAHEAIRPVDITITSLSAEEFTPAEIKLYTLIWNRTVTSQMSPTRVEIYTVQIHSNNSDDYYFIAKLEHIVFDGFQIVYNKIDAMPKINNTHNIIKLLANPAIVNAKQITIAQKFTKSVGRYTEASLIKTLEKMGIGRPSTWSNIISSLQNDKRGYVSLESKPGVEKTCSTFTLVDNNVKQSTSKTKTQAETNKLFVTETGRLVNKFLLQHFNSIIDYDFTSSIESKLDEIARGELKWYDIVKNTYDVFHPIVLQLKTATSMIDRNSDDCLGDYNEKPVLLKRGKYGAYLVYNNQNYTIDKKTDTAEMSLQDAINIIMARDNSILKVFGTISVRNGPYGLYIKNGNKFISLPSSITVENVDKLTLADVKVLTSGKVK